MAWIQPGTLAIRSGKAAPGWERLTVDLVTLPDGFTLAMDPSPDPPYLVEWSPERKRAWVAAHGGDPVATLRRQAKEAVDAPSPEAVARRAYALAARADRAGLKPDAELRQDARALIDSGKLDP